MQEFMFFIRKQASASESLPPDRHLEFPKSCETYIGRLKQEHRLISAQPIEWQGSILALPGAGSWSEAPFSESAEVIGGCYHILASSLAEAIAIAKANPEFVYHPSTRIEVRPIKMREEDTGFVYPTA